MIDRVEKCNFSVAKRLHCFYLKTWIIYIAVCHISGMILARGKLSLNVAIKLTNLLTLTVSFTEFHNGTVSKMIHFYGITY